MKRWKWSGKDTIQCRQCPESFPQSLALICLGIYPTLLLSWCVSSDIENLSLTRGWQGEMLPGLAVSPRTLMWAVKRNRRTAGSRKQHLGPSLLRHFSSVPQNHVVPHSPGPVCVLRGEDSPAVLQNWALLEGEPPCAAAGQRLRGVRRVKLNYWR